MIERNSLDLQVERTTIQIVTSSLVYTVGLDNEEGVQLWDYDGVMLDDETGCLFTNVLIYEPSVEDLESEDPIFSITRHYREIRGVAVPTDRYTIEGPITSEQLQSLKQNILQMKHLVTKTANIRAAHPREIPFKDFGEVSYETKSAEIRQRFSHWGCR